jgi:hypothetical protein
MLSYLSNSEGCGNGAERLTDTWDTWVTWDEGRLRLDKDGIKFLDFLVFGLLTLGIGVYGVSQIIANNLPIGI